MADPKKCTKIWVPPESVGFPPVHTRTQILPLNELPWDSFQRLCARLAQRCGNVEHSQEYGIPGQDNKKV